MGWLSKTVHVMINKLDKGEWYLDCFGAFTVNHMTVRDFSGFATTLVWVKVTFPSCSFDMLGHPKSRGILDIEDELRPMYLYLAVACCFYGLNTVL